MLNHARRLAEEAGVPVRSSSKQDMNIITRDRPHQVGGWVGVVHA